MSDGATTDLELLDGWRAGRNLDGEALFRRHFDALYRFFWNKAGADCEELLQRTLMACVRCSTICSSMRRMLWLGLPMQKSLCRLKECG